MIELLLLKGLFFVLLLAVVASLADGGDEDRKE